MSKWYVVKVTPGKERQLNEQFNNQINSGSISFVNRFVCPLEKEYVTIRKKKTLREKVIYNGYLYFESENLLTEDQLKTIAANSGIMSMFGDKIPRRMGNEDVSRILKDDLLEKHKESKIIKFIIGDAVTINEGPFKTFNGVINKINNEKVYLNVKVFGRDTAVEVNLDQISRVY